MDFIHGILLIVEEGHDLLVSMALIGRLHHLVINHNNQSRSVMKLQDLIELRLLPVSSHQEVLLEDHDQLMSVLHFVANIKTLGGNYHN